MSRAGDLLKRLGEGRKRFGKVTAAAVEKEFRDVDEGDAKKVEELVAKSGRGKSASNALLEINDVLDGYGVEHVEGDKGPSGYWSGAVAAYVNMGDTYNVTILYDTVDETFYLTDLGSFLDVKGGKYGVS